MATKYDPEIHGEFTEEMLRREAEIKQEFKARKMGLTVPYDPEIHGAIEDIQDSSNGVDVEFIRGADGRMLRVSGSEVFDARTGTKLGREVQDTKAQMHSKQSPIPNGFKVYEPTIVEIPAGFKRYEPVEALPPEAQVSGKYLDQLAVVESSNNPKAKAKTSSASGLFQFIDSTWLEYVPKAGIDTEGLSKEQILKLRFDPVVSRKVAAAFTAGNKERLSEAGVVANGGALYLAHFAGAGKAIQLYRADKDAPASSLFSEEAVRANRSILEGKTVGEVIAWADKKMGSVTEESTPVAEVPETFNTPANGNEVTLASKFDVGLYQDETGRVVQVRPDGSMVYL